MVLNPGASRQARLKLTGASGNWICPDSVELCLFLRRIGPEQSFCPATTRDFRVTSRAIRVDDAAITDLSGESVIRTEGPLGGPEDVVRLYVVRRGAWTLGSPDDPGEQTVSAGGFLLKHVARRCFDDVEPLLAPALTQAAKDLADSRLTDPDLCTATLARELNVSARTLQRAFTAAGESVTTYIRRRRLEEARLALSVPAGRLTISDLAAHWQFADSSHFIRTFKKRYGQTPTDYARSTPSPEG